MHKATYAYQTNTEVREAVRRNHKLRLKGIRPRTCTCTCVNKRALQAVFSDARQTANLESGKKIKNIHLTLIAEVDKMEQSDFSHLLDRIQICD